MTPLRALLHDSHFRRGARDMLDFAPGIAAWALVTGVAMAKSGLSLPLAVLMSLTVFAGTAQLAVAPLMASAAPIWVVWATALCLNLRFVVFSAQMRPYFAALPRWRRARLAFFCADLNFVLFVRRWPDARPADGQEAYFWGGVSLNATSWHLMSLVGIALGQRVPEAWGLGFAGTVALLAMIAGFITFGGGGIAAEVQHDNSLALPPLNDFLADQLIARTKVSRTLAEFKHMPAVDMATLKGVLGGVSEMICELPDLLEMDINPLVVDDVGGVVLDARIVVRKTATTRRYGHMAIMPYPSEMVEQMVLNDGTEVTIRPMRPEDADMQQEFVRNLSEESRYTAICPASSSFRSRCWCALPSSTLTVKWPW